MPDSSRYLELERRIMRSASRKRPGCLMPGDDGPGGDDDWTGTAERLPSALPDDGVAVQASVPMVVRAFDDGAPIELHYDDACPPAPVAVPPAFIDEPAAAPVAQ